MSRETTDQSVLTTESRIQINDDLSTSLPVRLRPTASTSPSKKYAQFCCCCPVVSGVWILAFFLAIPSIALVLCFNIANLQAYIQFNAPAPVKVVFTVIYALYALLGLTVVMVLHKIAPHRRFKSLIALYWILIAMTFLEGIYVGIIISEQKSKFVSYCNNNLPPPPLTANNGTISAVEVSKEAKKPPHPVICHNGQALVGVFYILGPGGWIMLHIGWILFVVLYSKALRKMYPAENDDEERFAPRPQSRIILAFPPASDQQQQTRPRSVFPLVGSKAFHGGPKDNHDKDKDLDLMFNTTRRFSSGLSHTGPFRQPNKGSPSHNPSIHMHPMSSIDGNDALRGANFSSRHEVEGSDADEDLSDEDDDADQDRLSDLSAPQRHRREGGAHSPEGSMSSRTDIPADGKGWWIRQIEGKRRGEICPCTLGNSAPCWCGKERRISHAIGTSDSQGSSSCTANILPKARDQL
ncbi:hypothetical protein EMPS_09246 [Entomortierella parvispora]|uniref:Uncharacterized protein n=1 Tax=Entomortierella parvispora TaxID=205924 RepID=A0A9P3HHU0_9FUNG|nr:hypothetical protein EMPS_09246 [Entomortierella parvispora]